MNEIKEITSLQNPLIKKILQLQEKARVRKKENCFVIEGQREIKLALESDYQIGQLLFCEEIITRNEVENIADLSRAKCEIIKISPLVFQKLSHRKTTEGLVAVSKWKDLNINNLKLSKNPLILVAEAIEKPGNIGALLRTADAARVDAVILTDPVSDPYNPNVIRSSVGCVFTNQLVLTSSSEAIDFLHRNKISIYAAALNKNSLQYAQCDFKRPTAIVVGTEASGLSESWLNSSLNKVMIPMQGKIDSLNVSVSAAILIFEAKRQRNFS